MTTFAIFFMTVSMASVTTLAGFCMYKLLNDSPSPTEEATESEDTR